MTREEILREIDEAMDKLTIAKKKSNDALCHARNIVARNGDDEAGYNKGLEDAWKLVKKIVLKAENGGLNYDDFKAIFGTDHYVGVLKNMTPQEALAKLEAYEKGQEEIKVGDVVKSGNGETEFVVIATSTETINRQPILRPIGKTLITGVVFGSDRDLKKTGKHIDISSILEQIKEN